MRERKVSSPLKGNVPMKSENSEKLLAFCRKLDNFKYDSSGPIVDRKCIEILNKSVVGVTKEKFLDYEDGPEVELYSGHVTPFKVLFKRFLQICQTLDTNDMDVSCDRLVQMCFQDDEFANIVCSVLGNRLFAVIRSSYFVCENEEVKVAVKGIKTEIKRASTQL